MTRRRGTGAILIACAMHVALPPLGHADEAETVEPEAGETMATEESSTEATAEPPPQDRADVSDEGVPDQAVEASEAVSEVEEAMEKVEAATEAGLPIEFTIEFGDTYDWMRLTSGEWLKGRLKSMREDEVEFDSDKLNIVKFSWDKVDQLHCPDVNTYVFDDKLDVVGRGVVTNDNVLIETTEGVETYPRIELLSIVEGEPRERNFWSTRASFGFSGTAGNTNQGQLNAHWDLARADQRTRTELSYDGSFGYANSEQTVNRHLGRASLKLFISRRFFIVPATADFLNDKFQNLKFKTTPAAGAGIHIFDTKKYEWDVGGAVGYQYTEFFSTAATVKNPQNDGFLSVYTYAELEFYKDVELDLEWRTSVVYTDIGLTSHFGSAKFSVEITDIFDLETTFNFYRTENPPARADGTQPKKNDYEFIVSLALEIG